MTHHPLRGLILSAGASSRMGRPKALLAAPNPHLGDETFLSRLSARFIAAGADPVLVVLGAHAAEIGPHVPPGLRSTVAADWSRGMRASLRAGLLALPPGPVLLTHVDRPQLRPSTLTAIVAAARAAPDRPIVPHHAGRPGHPVIIPAALRPRLVEPDDQPLRDILRPASPVAVAVDDPGVLLNINTPDDYRRLLAGAACI